MTVKELYEQIKIETMKVNQRLVEYYEDGKPIRIVDKEIKVLKEISGTSQNMPYLSLNLHRKNKNQLTAQLNFLTQFQEWDMYTPQALREEEQRAYRAYQTFRHNNRDSKMQFKTYRRAVTIIGSLSDRILNAFDSKQIMPALEYAFSKGKKLPDMFKAFEEVLNEYEGASKYNEDYIDAWYQKLNL